VIELADGAVVLAAGAWDCVPQVATDRRAGVHAAGRRLRARKCLADRVAPIGSSGVLRRWDISSAGIVSTLTIRRRGTDHVD
jgi:hypothetical protein